MSPKHPPALPPASRCALLLDFDGTLVDIAPTPESVVVPDGLADALVAVRQRCGGALALITGRPVEQVDTLLPGVAFAVAGEHGTALRPSPGGAVAHAALPSPPPGWREQAEVLVRRHHGSRLEPKRHGFVLHYRAAPEHGPALLDGLRGMVSGPQGNGFAVLAAKMAWELRPAGTDKGSALRAVMALDPFCGRLPVFIGDDVTDEDAIEAARAMGGVGLRVDEAFGEPRDVRAWLGALAEGTGWGV